MSKQDSEAFQLPSYDEAIQTPPLGKQSLLPKIQTQIRDEILDLSVRFQSVLVQRREDQITNDERILDILREEIRVFLNDYISSALPKATLLLVPAGVIPDNSVNALDDLRDEDDFGRLVQVVTDGKENESRNESSWEGRDMTERLAICIQSAVKSVPKAAGRPEAQRPMLPAKAETKSSFWKRFSSPPADDRNLEIVTHSETKRPQLPKVSIDVQAEDVIFRVETPFGSYDTASVWGLVIKLHVTSNQSDRR